MVLTALFIAVGSSRPVLREWGVDQLPGVRRWFDLTDLQFFDAWPLKVLMALLITNLVVVTWRRIPLTPPRYGVWCVHLGIIILILSTGYYYNRKLEGRVRLYTNPSLGPTVVDHFYDKDERSLYLKVNDTFWNAYPLANLPKFNEYDEPLGNSAELTDRKGLSHIVPIAPVDIDPATRKPVLKSLSQMLGWKDEVSFDVVGYYPYAVTSTDFVDDPSSKTVGVHLTVPEMREGQDVEAWAVSADPRFRDISAFGTEFEHRTADPTLLPALLQSASRLFHLDITLPNFHQQLDVQPGAAYPLANTGYTLKIENFDPAWNMFATHEQVQALTMQVTSPARTFRRMVLNGKDVQTDFVLNAPGAGPMGKRQKAPLDNDLKVLLRFDDPYNLLPQGGPGGQGGDGASAEKHTLITPLDGKQLIDITASYNAATVVHRFDSGSGDVELAPPADESASPPFAMAGLAASAPPDAAPAHPAVKIRLDRQDHMRRVDTASAVPPSRRDRNVEDAGAAQLVKVRVNYGDWSQTIAVPFTEEAGDTPNNAPWDGGSVAIPNTPVILQLQLGNTRRALPAKVTLDKFELIPYPGGDVNNPRAMMRDFRSTLTIDDPDNGEMTDVAHLNHPVYFRGNDWLLFQAAYDGQDRSWTQLGVGNRPGVHEMILGCAMIFIGLAYAFYAKPIVIRRMKENALKRAAQAADERRAAAELQPESEPVLSR
jgi:hypothetical protein